MQGGSRGQAAEGGHCGASSAPRWPHGSRLPRPNTSSSRSARSPRMPFFRTASYLATNKKKKVSVARNISAEKSDFISDSNLAKQPGRGCFAPSAIASEDCRRSIHRAAGAAVARKTHGVKPKSTPGVPKPVAPVRTAGPRSLSTRSQRSLQKTGTRARRKVAELGWRDVNW